MRITILGCGGSLGVPHIGGDWGACDPSEPRNRRLRASILVEEGDTRLLIDTSPDLRQQLLAVGVNRLDAVVYTHAHADHLHGLNDLRAVNMAMGGPLPAYADPRTASQIRRMFGYALEPLQTVENIYRPWVSPLIEIDGRPFRVGDIEVEPFEQDHGMSISLGFRFNGRAVYSSDLVAFPEPARGIIQDAELWIVNAFRRQPHSTHSHLAQTLRWIGETGVRRAVLTHLGSDMDYRETLAACPPHVLPAHDGMTIDLS